MRNKNIWGASYQIWEVHAVNEVCVLKGGVQRVKYKQAQNRSKNCVQGCMISNCGGARGSEMMQRQPNKQKNKAGVQDRKKWRCTKNKHPTYESRAWRNLILGVREKKHTDPIFSLTLIS